MKVLLTGVSSFTGHWIARAIVEEGHELCCPLTGACSYDGVRRARMNALPASVRVVEHGAFGTPEFLALVRDFRPQALCHHGAFAKNYKSADFDPLAALANNTRQADEVLKQFVASGGSLLLITGTFFEANEAQGELPRRAFSLYGLSKTLTSQLFDYYAAVHGVTFGKFVIPNPFGKFEEPRFIAYLTKSWAAHAAAIVKTPDYIRDNIPVDLLSCCYALFLNDLFRKPPVQRAVLRPSGYMETQGQFAERVAREFRLRTGLPCALEFAEQADFSEPRARFNDQAARQMIQDWDENAFWDMLVDYYAGQFEASK